MNAVTEAATPARHAQIIPIDASKLGGLAERTSEEDFLYDWDIVLDENEDDVQSLRLAAERLRTSNIPVAFPTETVYGLGADATRSEAVKGIYAAKQRPSDNPLIVHFASLRQLKELLRSGQDHTSNGRPEEDLLPPIYLPLIKEFWPGPLTIILPNPPNSPLAPEVTAGLSTFGARMPRNLLALLLIKLSGKPIAAPSANASTKPSPTAAEHVMEDLDGRIEYIIDGGPCDVGVESTVVDGLSSPPAVLRPGGISIEQLRVCPGWEHVIVAYEDVSLKKGAPRAPGMKYRHYSPKAKVFLYDAGAPRPELEALEKQGFRNIGFIQTRHWKSHAQRKEINGVNHVINGWRPPTDPANASNGFSVLNSVILVNRPELRHVAGSTPDSPPTYWEIQLGDTAIDVARDLFWALRELDRQGCDVICVEGIGSDEGDVAAAVMNRLRKAAEVHFER
jgi:L-threonylcarbamoyladenylate synthase